MARTNKLVLDSALRPAEHDAPPDTVACPRSQDCEHAGSRASGASPTAPGRFRAPRGRLEAETLSSHPAFLSIPVALDLLRRKWSVVKTAGSLVGLRLFPFMAAHLRPFLRGSCLLFLFILSHTLLCSSLPSSWFCARVTPGTLRGAYASRSCWGSSPWPRAGREPYPLCWCGPSSASGWCFSYGIHGSHGFLLL